MINTSKGRCKGLKKIISHIDLTAIIFTIVAILLQVGIIVMIPFVFEGNVPVHEEKTVTISFKPDKVERIERRIFKRRGGSNIERNVYFYNNEVKYKYPYQFFSQYDGEDLVKDLENEYLTVTIKEGTNKVVAIEGEETTFITLESYNSSATLGLVFGILFMIFIEAIYLFACGYYVFGNYVPPYSYRGFAYNKIGIHIHNYQCRKYNIK